MSNRFKLKNILNHNDIFRDMENKEDLDSLDIVRILNNYDDTLSNFVKREVEQQDKISDLEAKLAESEEQLLQKEKKIQNLMLCEFVATTLDFNKLSADNCRLREQLAEKDVELELARNTSINTNKMDIIHLQAEILELKQQLSEKDKQIDEYADSLSLVLSENADLAYKHQDKISSCIEQLEEFKEFLNTTNKTGSYVYYGDCWTTKIDKDSLLNYIDNQIASLKKGVE